MNLLHDNILGIIDPQGLIDSRNTGDKIECHGEYFPQTNCQWRWDRDKGLWWILAERRPTGEQQEEIKNHLTRKYGIKWMENGYHDEDDLHVRFQPDVTFTKIKRTWRAERNKLIGEGKTKKEAIRDLLITEMYQRIGENCPKK